MFSFKSPPVMSGLQLENPSHLFTSKHAAVSAVSGLSPSQTAAAAAVAATGSSPPPPVVSAAGRSEETGAMFGPGTSLGRQDGRDSERWRPGPCDSEP